MNHEISFVLLSLLTLVSSMRGQGSYENILVFEQNLTTYPPCEPSIAIDPNDPEKMVAGAVLDHVFTSADSGKSWEAHTLQSRYGVYGDPCVIADDKGAFYYFHLSDPSGKGWESPAILDRLVCQKMSTWGKGWNSGWSIGHNHPKDQDKEWAAWDPVRGRLVLTWTQFDTYGDANPKCESNILLSTSKTGKKWSTPIKINSISGNCIDKSETAEGAVPTFDNEGNILVSWGLDGKIIFNKIRFDAIDDYETKECIVVDGGADWAFEIPGIGRANGMPITLCDRSGGPFNGNVYINWSDQRNGVDDTDIWLVKSSDGGDSWSAPIRINDDGPGKHQFFTWMAIDQSTGFLYAVFYDRRDHTGIETDVYLAVSKDGGSTWTNERISESAFVPTPTVFFGDYNNIAAVNGVIRPIWTRCDDGKLSIWTAIINE